MSMAFRTCPECRWNKVGHYCGKQFTLNGFECINFDKKETKEMHKKETFKSEKNNYMNEELEWIEKEIRKRRKSNIELMTEFKDLTDDDTLCHDCRINRMKEINIRLEVNNEMIQELDKLRKELENQ